MTPRPKPPGRLSLGDIVDLTLRTLRAHWRPLLLLYAIFDVPLFLLGSAVADTFAIELERAAGGPGLVGTPGAISPEETADLLPLLGQVVVAALVSGVVGTVGAGAVALAMGEASDGRKPSVRAALAGALRRSPAMLGGAALAVAVVVAVAAAAGLLLLLLGIVSGDAVLAAGGGPVTFLALIVLVAAAVVIVAVQVRWAFVAQAVVLEGAGLLGSLRLSWAVTSGATWRVFRVLLVLTFVVAVLSSLFLELAVDHRQRRRCDVGHDRGARP